MINYCVNVLNFGCKTRKVVILEYEWLLRHHQYSALLSAKFELHSVF